MYTTHQKLLPHINVTPVITAPSVDDLASASGPGFRIFFKCENYQRIGAFKFRGALNAVLGLIETLGVDEVRRRGVTTHSSGESKHCRSTDAAGNHAQALSCAAATFGIPAHIVMPRIAPTCKVDGTRQYTSHIYFSGHTSAQRQAVMQEVIDKIGAIYVPSTDHPDIMLGQATASLELQQQYTAEAGSDGSLRAVLTPLGGGGLLSGASIFFSDRPNTAVIGCEPSHQGANDGERGFKADPPQRIETVETLTIADGLRVPVAKRPWEVFHTSTETKPRLLENIYSVTEQQIKDALRIILEQLKVYIEPSSAVPLAVVLYNQEFRRWAMVQQRQEGVDCWDIGIILSGGNCSIDTLFKLLAKGEQTVPQQASSVVPSTPHGSLKILA